MGLRTFMNGSHVDPSPEAVLEALRQENEQLRNKLVDTEREYIRITRLNDIYREELIDHRRRLGLPLDNLIGLSSDPLSQPTHRQPTSYSISNGSSPSTSVYSRPSHPQGVPIPRAHTSYRPPNHISSSELNTPLSHSPSFSESPYPLFSPGTSAATNAASIMTSSTNITSPPSSASLNNPPTLSLTPGRGLTYPSVPPPSLSSSFGSPTVSFHIPHRDPSLSPIEPLSRRNSNARRGSISRSGGPSGGGSASRRASLDFGARVAETGTLVPRPARSRAGSQSAERQLEATLEVEVFDNDLGVVDESEDVAGGTAAEKESKV
ncbi:hypothetical protein CC2G_004109 [Coprinopsis cinerea AmutBmut pab1-1]|nr:hypothetical protein CC2G_004109 [Coprinopsis cinerea AmutBmut pab1-1]